MLNVAVLIGRLTKNPELKYTQGSGTPVATFTLAVDRNYTNQQGKREADFIPIVAWRKLAETCANNLTKGRLVAVVGRIQTRTWDDQDGKRHYVTDEAKVEGIYEHFVNVRHKNGYVISIAKQDIGKRISIQVKRRDEKVTEIEMENQKPVKEVQTVGKRKRRKKKEAADITPIVFIGKSGFGYRLKDDKIEIYTYAHKEEDRTISVERENFGLFVNEISTLLQYMEGKAS